MAPSAAVGINHRMNEGDGEDIPFEFAGALIFFFFFSFFGLFLLLFSFAATYLFVLGLLSFINAVFPPFALVAWKKGLHFAFVCQRQ